MYFRKSILYLLLFISLQSSCQENNSSKSYSDIVGMVHIYGKKKYNAFSRTWKFSKESTWLLLKNGWALKNPRVSPDEINFENSLKENPSDWIQWKNNKMFEKASIYGPSPENARYDLNVKLYSVNGSPISNSVTTSTLVLKKNGRFETSHFTLSEITSGESSTKIMVRENKEGKKNNFGNTTGTGTGTVYSSKSSSEKSFGDYSGTYKINGHSIQLNFDNGKTIRTLFATDGKENVILGTHFYFGKASSKK